MTANINRSKLDLVLIGLWLVGVATIVLPFTSGYSPLKVVLESFSASGIWPFLFLGGPFFLAMLVFYVSLRAIVGGRISRAESACAWIAAGGAACGTLFFLVMLLTDRSPFDWRELATVAATSVVTIVAVGTIVWAARRPGERSRRAVMAMQWAYVSNATFCLLAFWPAWQAGAYLTLATVLVYLTHIATMLWRAPGRRAMIAPGQGQVSHSTGGTT